MEQRPFLVALSHHVSLRGRQAVGAELGLSHDAIRSYLLGERVPSLTVRLLAGYVWGRQGGGWPLDDDAGGS